jgi:hypothetical protein
MKSLLVLVTIGTVCNWPNDDNHRLCFPFAFEFLHGYFSSVSWLESGVSHAERIEKYSIEDRNKKGRRFMFERSF